MDDIYFGVLRLWHLLTSSKKVLVAVVGVVAVVATVTTVFAAPTEETEGVVASGATPQQATPVVSAIKQRQAKSVGYPTVLCLLPAEDRDAGGIPRLHL